MSEAGRWVLAGTVLMTMAFVLPGMAAAIPSAGPAPSLRPTSLVFPGHGGAGGGHGGGSFTCPTISGAGSSVCSTNWAGYADTATGGVTYVSGMWIVPSLNCPKRGTSYVAIWVGIDGYTSSSVEQTGTMGVCSHGAATYSAWYEFYPSPSYSFSVTVKPGDSILASVTYSSGQYTVSLSVNGGTAQTQSATVSAAQGSSAEWIVERPALCTVTSCRLTTLANFGSTGFSSASATIGGSSGTISATGFSDVAITMVGGSSGPVLAQPSPLSSGGASFSVAYG
jgi:Peptidase A4 family